MVTHLSQYEVKVKLERLVRKTLPAQSRAARRSRLGLPDRRHFGRRRPRIVIEGPASVMQVLDSWRPCPSTSSGRRESLTVEPRIDYQGKPVKLLEKNIAVHVNIERTKK